MCNTVRQSDRTLTMAITCRQSACCAWPDLQCFDVRAVHLLLVATSMILLEALFVQVEAEAGPEAEAAANSEANAEAEHGGDARCSGVVTAMTLRELLIAAAAKTGLGRHLSHARGHYA